MEEVVAWAFFFFLSQAGGEGAMGFTAPFDFSSGDFFSPYTLDDIDTFAYKHHSDLLRATTYYFDYHSVLILNENLVSYFSCS